MFFIVNYQTTMLYGSDEGCIILLHFAQNFWLLVEIVGVVRIAVIYGSTKSKLPIKRSFTTINFTYLSKSMAGSGKHKEEVPLPT